MVSIHISSLLKFYKRLDIQRAIVGSADNKEVAVKFGDRGFGGRPDVLKYPKDVLEFAKRGATSFHASEELWSNPLGIRTGMSSNDLDELRVGWDLILDVDSRELHYSRLASHLLVLALRYFGVGSVSVKFSGNHGFHIGVPFEAFPSAVGGRPVRKLFPEGPRKIAVFLQEKIREPLARMLVESHSLSEIAERSGKGVDELMKDGRFDPFVAVGIDTVLIANRHLYRMPYVFNEKSGLVSVVIRPEDILSFDVVSANHENVMPSMSFLPRDSVISGEARRLIVEAFDFKQPVLEMPESTTKREFEPLEGAVPEEFFPPCIKKISLGLKDGRKRAMFVLINFLGSVGWSHDMIEDYIKKWNERNSEPLRDVLIKGHLRYVRGKKSKLPPNCDNSAYMVGMGVCSPDGFCGRVKNPANYAIRMCRAKGSGKKGKRSGSR